ncbi:ADP-ribose glycohydrolase OARD1 isoform X2 [Haemorhous mexicanus]|uniref:ADP-ribose glycohydrolase OARD1 isoform X2 n=1 Tax=Haemorhous mexicanus TaxID=30427 RepID=UPI0028BDE9BE|nr:ADP-ribose glycohydrolase OARD1 isoform X2 [Haemorhous mexicanus]
MWAALGRLGVAQAVGPARLIAVRPAAAGAFSIPHVTMATHFSKDQERIRCVKGDLFSCPGTDALAHCISEDCRMGAGIAVLFKKKFGGVQELLDQNYKAEGFSQAHLREHAEEFGSHESSLPEQRSHRHLHAQDWMWTRRPAVGKGVSHPRGGV